MSARFTRWAAVTVMALLSIIGVVTQINADGSSFTPKSGIGHASGEEIYNRICQGCHMPAGKGATGAGAYPKLAGDPALIAWEYVAITVLNGRNGMPPFGLPAEQVLEAGTVHLSDEQIAAVVNYVRSSFGNQHMDKVSGLQVAKLPHPGT